MTEQQDRIILPSEGSHWYYGDGTPCYTVPLKKPAKDGRTTTEPTIAHARVLKLFPSVTNTLSLYANRGLERWKVEEALNFGYNAGRDAAPPEKVAEMFVKHSSRARDRGSLLHGEFEKLAVDQAYKTEEPAAEYAYDQFNKWLLELGITQIYAEKSFCNRQLGFAGKVDFCGEQEISVDQPKSPVVIDFKFIQKQRNPYDKECWQGAAYCKGLGHQFPIFYNVYFIESTGEMLNPFLWSTEEIEFGWVVFSRLFETWVAIKKYDPRLNI